MVSDAFPARRFAPRSLSPPPSLDAWDLGLTDTLLLPVGDFSCPPDFFFNSPSAASIDIVVYVYHRGVCVEDFFGGDVGRAVHSSGDKGSCLGLESGSLFLGFGCV